MGPWLTILLTILPPLLAFLESLLKNKKSVNAVEARKLAKVLRLTDELHNKADELGIHPE